MCVKGELEPVQRGTGSNEFKGKTLGVWGDIKFGILLSRGQQKKGRLTPGGHGLTNGRRSL